MLVLPMVWRAGSLDRRFAGVPRSLVVLDRQGELLDARIASDTQWRFPDLTDTLPTRYLQAVVAFEDRRFFWHPGVDPVGIGGALRANANSRSVERGASTLTMQVVRLSRANPPRTLGEKILEAILAVAVEVRHSKKEILRAYASHAPFGGNTVGLEAASWRYFGRGPAALSWGEAALLAVLPNQPSLMHPGRHRDALLAKRNRLIASLRDQGAMDSLEAQLAMAEPLPGPPPPLPRLASPLLQTLHEEHPRRAAFPTTLDASLQSRLLEELRNAGQGLRRQGIGNGAVVILDNKTGFVIAYAGNVPGADTASSGATMDLVRARRSSGSILKPFLYEMLFEGGELFPWTLVPDIPTTYAGFLPENFDRTWKGALPASEALALSRNAPAAKLLAQAGVGRFHSRLRSLGLSTLNRPAESYGLSLILGGAEATVWDLAGMYARLSADAQTLPAWNEARLLSDPPKRSDLRPRFSPAAAWWTLETLREVNRPDEDKFWKDHVGSRPLAWKTGTSNGHRDAWAVGTSPRWTVAVWVGNPDGAGMPDIVGRDAAAPVLFRVVSLLPPDGWFSRPVNGWKMVEICPSSGRPAGPYCPVRDPRAVSDVPLHVAPCVYHQTIMVNAQGRRAHDGCANGSALEPKTVFSLPPEQAFFWNNSHSDEPALPSWSPACAPTDEDRLVIAYPAPGAKLYLPRDLDERRNPTVLRAAYTGKGKLHWHLDGRYLGATEQDHQIPVVLAEGEHTATVVDGSGRSVQRTFTVLSP